MSDAWAMNPGKAATAVGTATIEADDELFTITDHGLGVGDTVVVDTLTGGASGVLDEGQVYWVVDVSTNTFALSQHRNGTPVAFSSDGGADVYRFAPQYTAVELRRLDSGLLANDSGDRFGARAGIHPACDPAISVSGTTWTVENVVGTIYPALTSTSGPYRFAHPTESGSLDPADGSNPRIDALDLQIQDNDEDASGQRRARVVYVSGTPASSPSAPAQTSNSLRLGTILVPAGGSPSPSVSDDVEPLFIAATGGVIVIRDSSERPTSGLYDGLTLYNQDTGTFEVRDGGAWLVVPPVRIATVTNEVTSDTNVGESETTVVSAPSITGDGSTRVKVTIKWYGVHNDGTPTTSFLQLRILRGATTIDQIVLNVNSTSAHLGGEFSTLDTPPAGAQTYAFAANPLTADAGNVVDAASNAPVSIRVEQVFD